MPPIRDENGLDPARNLGGSKTRPVFIDTSPDPIWNLSVVSESSSNFKKLKEREKKTTDYDLNDDATMTDLELDPNPNKMWTALV